MTFPRSEYPPEAAGQFGPHVEWAGGDFYFARQSSRVRGVLTWMFASGACMAIAGILGTAAYASGKDPIPPLMIGGFFLSAAFCFGSYGFGVAGRLIKDISGAETIIEIQEFNLRLAGLEYQRLRAGEALAAGESSGGSREGATLSPAANVYRINAKRKEPFQ